MIAHVSGHVDISWSEFEKHYIPALDKAIESKHKFVIGAARGADKLALDYLIGMGVPRTDITLYVFDPHLDLEHAKVKMAEEAGVSWKIGFKSYTDCDAHMTENSNYDIAWVRPVEESRKLYGDKFDPTRKSGTQKNLERRAKRNENKSPNSKDNK